MSIGSRALTGPDAKIEIEGCTRRASAGRSRRRRAQPVVWIVSALLAWASVGGLIGGLIWGAASLLHQV
jgi:hypothetical protein